MINFPGKKRNKYGGVHTVKGIFKKAGKVFYSIIDVLREEADSCNPCGCDPCLGYWTNIDVSTGELQTIFVEDGGIVSMEYSAGKEYLKTAKSKRDSV